jgi:hypothetical protein
VSLHFYQIGWTVCFVLQGFFALRGLTFDRASVHYKNCLMLKIKLNFMLLCALFILSFVFIAFFVNDSSQKLLYVGFVVIANFAILKCKYGVTFSPGAAVSVPTGQVQGRRP